MKIEPSIHPREPTHVLPGLLQRIAPHSPELVIIIEQYLKLNGEIIHGRLTYSGGDPSAHMMFHLVESLLHYERLRIELHEQIQVHRIAGEVVPGHLMLAASDLVVLEPGLLQALNSTFEIHLNIWDANKTEYLSSAKSRERNRDVPHDHGRWDRPPPIKERD